MQTATEDSTKEIVKMKSQPTSAFLATAVGLMFMANVALAQENAAAG
jgi:hypothetical protein